ncbi:MULTISPECIES: YhcN/YlaJ family sporulation lipoprotein [unclassified Lysinibacillus]|uniref:YhcN/YlaJ family sporulation lipoprotein n=1 Tax=unclassified Lysinibacillus TaxID=2636778 RepID=UPI001F0D4F0B|nr:MULTISPECIES: YhcN/YlaJ family sporulation lipoprotein [unclassified Lysinibacillus]
MGVVLLLVGCNDQEKVVMYPETNDEQMSKEIQKLLEEAKEIEEANVVFMQNELFVAMQLKPFDKWKKQKYEKDWKKKLEKKFPDETVHVSTDFKLFWESTKLMDEKNHEKVLEKIQKLKKLAKEET